MTNEIVRPTGVTILAILSFLGGLSGILTFEYYTFLSIISLLIALINLVNGWGLWTIQEWAHPVALILQIVSIILSPFNYLLAASIVGVDFGFFVPALLFGWIISAIIIAYLHKPEIRETFGATEGFINMKAIGR